MVWLPILQIETNKTQHSTSSAVESLRNEQTKGQQQMIDIAKERMKLVGGN